MKRKELDPADFETGSGIGPNNKRFYRAGQLTTRVSYLSPWPEDTNADHLAKAGFPLGKSELENILNKM